ncbi:MFS general substrate transporter [Lophiostoma macrostomum CBS 122681]|uniref:MFS general substrate transporter n=1 Tax=Lophiostoma macrostomum CBS 122681 TaxID=1314788 RepID=A0A6A6THF3_9PLEO|nr:MFS general substrate transporter [Lophiostoma macrostomum CBS 122681]
MASALHSLFDIQPASSTVTSPPATHQRSKGHVNEAPSAIELDEYSFGERYNGPRTSEERAPGTQTPIEPKTPNELEMSRPASPMPNEAVGLMQSWNNPPKNKWRLLSCCLIYFINGINDSVTGALIPYMERQYRINYTIMSLIFVGQAAGFIVAAFFNNTILGKFGRAKTLMAAEVILLLSYVIMLCTPPYGAVIVAFFLLGYGMAMTLALNNVFCANLHPPTVVLGAAHGSYGIGGTIAPIVATAMVSRGTLWSRFYFLPFGLAVIALFFAGWAFWDYKEEANSGLLTALERTASRQATQEPVPKLHDLKLALRNRTTVFGALFIFAYQGAEVSISGWVISFLITFRDGDPASVGYVTAGFWGGITLGRFVLTHLTPRYIGERTFVFLLVAGAAAFQLLAWLVPNIITNAVAVSILGLLLGPIYPCAQTIFTKLLPRHVQTTAVGFIAGAGSSGGAIAPFTTGVLAQAVGTFVLHPVCIGLYAVMVACWVGLPRVRKRTE